MAAGTCRRGGPADLGEWVEERLAEPVPGVATVVVHSIVWQYVAPESRDRMRAALRRAGRRATSDAPVAWLRFEPAGPVGDLRLTWWPGRRGETVLATAEYHGVPVYWGRGGARPRVARRSEASGGCGVGSAIAPRRASHQAVPRAIR